MVIKKLNRWLLLAALLVSGVAWSAWQWYQTRYPTWQEEVQLSDGRVIVVKQKHEVYENYGTNQSWVTFSLPDVADGNVYAFGVPRGIRQFNFYRKPKHYIVAFRWTGNEFTRIPFLDVPERLRQEENILPCVPTAGRNLVSLSSKRERWCPVRGDRWKFGRTIRVSDYDELANFYSDLDNTKPATD
jgi:hypothetical protein